MKVRQRIGVLNDRLQTAKKLERDGMQDQYEREAAYTYGLLRETWERCVEEVLVGGVVERYRQTIQTQHIGVLARTTDEDCATLQDAMTKTSRWLPGHDQAPAENVTIPNAAELEADIQGLVLWVKTIEARRKAGHKA